MVNTVISNIPQPGADLRLVYDRYVRYLLFTSAALMSIIVLSIIFFMGQQGLQTFREVSPMEFFFSTRWDPLDEKFGGAGFIVGSVYAAVLAVIFGAPLGLAGAVFMAKIAPKRVREIMRPANDLYVAIPSVVYGYLGLTVLVPFLRDELKLGMGFGLFAAGLILGIMILPTVISISEDALRSVPSSLEEASIALGATRWQTIWKVLIPTAMPGIMTAVILAMARAIGETAPIITVGALTFIAFLPPMPFQGEPPAGMFDWLAAPFTVMPIQMFNWTSRPEAAFLNNAAAAGFILVLMTLTMNGLAIWLRYRLRKNIKW